ncbi:MULTISPECIES: hypothetical protein [Streptomycetaceae]|uniref:Formate-dependent nitrite reductase complex subunit NrfF n=1 Tax=Kitasatospora indigofera TaxID=67307 RepID=A0A919FLV0_9ACTN|nr:MULTISPECIES: hypothetical protein [Streptomycetaceae]MDQ0309464.1 hypothetical protein [Kitasatospora herbaricolor]OKI11751.1 hypothetical protein A6A07_20660 [Streptomyces sp. CB03911]GGV01671.1 hypothetical protein GCM10010495_10990 [Kitasatospora herbaricolor]GHH68687.1 hypothetical protein GCM10018781_26110 [Kitasatospora indigofera]
MEQRAVVRCAEGHLFSTTTFPMQNLGPARLGPGRLIRCPQCGRMRSSVLADVRELSEPQLERALRLEAAEFLA